ncbi:MAG: GldG family protein [Sphingomonas bacterium]|nr:GldG family protein [Sphingomonas bacterium]
MLAAVALLATIGCRAQPATKVEAKPIVHVLTSLPLLLDEGFGLGPAKGEAAVFLREHFQLKPIDLPSQLPPSGVLLVAQPRALPAEELVALDGWVRGGGRLVLLADPMLEWPSERPFGDRLRPPMSFADTGLLAHWGLRLDAPDKRGVSYDRMNGAVAFISPGTLVKMGGKCAIEEGGWKALCQLGKGNATIIADADFLNVEAIRAAKGFPSDNLRMIETSLSPPLQQAR